MAIQLVNDVIPPVAVAAVDIVMKQTMPTYADYAVYGMTALGYIGAFLNWGGDFVKNVGIAAAPMALEKLYAMVVTPAASRVGGARSVTFNPSPAGIGGHMASSRAEFANIKL